MNRGRSSVESESFGVPSRPARVPRRGANDPHGASQAGAVSRGVLIALGLIALAIVIAVVGGSLIFLQRNAVMAGTEAVVSRELPLVPGDVVRMELDSVPCETPVLDVLSDGRVLVMPCGATRAAPLDRALLRVPLFPADGTLVPTPGDVVLARDGARWQRASVVATEPDRGIRVRPMDATNAASPERVVAASDVVLVQRAPRAPVE